MLGLEGAFGHAMHYEVRALTDVALCSLDVDSFKRWIGPLDSMLGTVLRLSLEEAMRRAGERQAVEGTALRRVARFLTQATTEGPNEGEPRDIPLGVLANILGMRPETLSRALSELRAAGALASGRTLRVVNREKLRLAAE
jgi:CRP-like cAMP-binding protein